MEGSAVDSTVESKFSMNKPHATISGTSMGRTGGAESADPSDGINDYSPGLGTNVVGCGLSEALQERTRPGKRSK